VYDAAMNVVWGGVDRRLDVGVLTGEPVPQDARKVVESDPANVAPDPRGALTATLRRGSNVRYVVQFASSVE
jgi:hypothetical protein